MFDLASVWGLNMSRNRRNYSKGKSEEVSHLKNKNKKQKNSILFIKTLEIYYFIKYFFLCLLLFDFFLNINKKAIIAHRNIYKTATSSIYWQPV